MRQLPRTGDAVERLTHEGQIISPHDYPVLFWLARLLLPGMRVFDWGGNVGTSYFACRNILPFPGALDWLVRNVPAYDQPDAATLMNIGYGFSAQHLFDQGDLEAAFSALGYGIADKWQTPGLGCFIPFNPSHPIDAYSGWCLTRDVPG